MTRGIGKRGVDFFGNEKPTFLVYADKIAVIPDKIYRDGVKVDFSFVTKNEHSFISKVKSMNYVDNIMARHAVRKRGYHEAVFINTGGFITETATSNIFMVKKGIIYTSPVVSGLLPGITRQTVIPPELR